MYPFNIGLVASTPDIWEQTQSALRELPVKTAFEMSELGSTEALLDKVDRYRPDVVLFEITGFEDQLDELFGAIVHSPGAPKIFALSNNSDPQQILAAVRAGASEYMFPPVADALTTALERMSREFERGPMHERTPTGRICGFLSVKGGCGATTLACHAAVEMHARTNKDVLLADLDLDCGIVRFLMQAKSRYSVYDAMRNLPRLDASYWGGLVSTERSGVDILGAPLDGADSEDLRTRDVRHVLRFLRTQYAYTIADLGRGIDEFRMEALHEVDDLVLVSTLEVPALHRATAISRYIIDNGFNRSRLRFVLNRMPRNTDVEIEDVEKVLALDVFESIPEDYAPLEAAYRKGRLLAAEQLVRRRIGRLAAKLAGADEPVVAAVPRKRKFALFSFDAKEAI